MSGARWAVVLAGGVGSRFWPLSTPERPKQVLPLASDRPMLVDTIDRLRPVAEPGRTLILTNAALAPALAELVPAIPQENILAEPRPAGTAAALTWAAHVVAQRDGREAPIVSVHADWAVRDVSAFRAALSAAADAAVAEQALVTVGVVPTRAETGLGYILPGGTVHGALRRVAQFVEKPRAARAAELVAAGALWNSGIFAWRAGDILDEVRALCPEVAPALAEHADDADAFFAAVRPIAIDTGVLERSARVMVLPGDFGWSDVGTWAALREVRALDADGNASAGNVILRDSSRNVVHAEGTTVVCYGVDDLVVVAVRGVTLVTSTDRAVDLKSLVDALPPEVRDR